MTKTKKITLVALFTALTAICSQIIIPLPMIPINLATFAVFLSGAVLGSKLSSLSMLCYMLLGTIGAPVFTGLKGGIGVLLGSTGGYIIGYIFCAFTIGLLAEKWGTKFWQLVLSMALGLFCCYFFGTAWFMILTKNTLSQSLIYCVYPFLLGDAVKIALASFVAIKLRPHLNLG